MSRLIAHALRIVTATLFLLLAGSLLFKASTDVAGRSGDAGGAVFVDSGQIFGGETGNGVAMGDLDGDGDMDAFVANNYSPPEANQVWFNQGGGIFSQGPTLGVSDGKAVALGDLDDDNDLDAVVATPFSVSGVVWINQGGAQGGDEGDFAAGVSLGSSGGYGVAIGDVDDDGDLDAFIVGNSNQVWLNNGDATFAAGPALPSLFSSSVVLADLDGDSWMDAVIADSGTGATNRIYWNDGNWVPGPGSFTAGDAMPTGNLMQGVAVAHLDDDSWEDLFFAGSGPDQIYWNEGGRTFSTDGPLPVSDSSSTIAVADVDGDSLVDAVIGNWDSDPNRLWRNQGGRVFTITQEFGDEFGLYWSRGFGLTDLTGDGAPDLFDVTIADDRVWFNQSAPPIPGPEWQIQSVAQRGESGLGASMALDSAGRPHISHIEYIERPTDDDLRLIYTAWDGLVWNSSVVDTADVMFLATSLALDSLGRPHIVYEIEEAGIEELHYAVWDGAAWQRQTVDPDAEPRGHFSLALDDLDRPHISYYDAVGDDLRYARWDGIEWQLEVVDSGGNVGRHNSLALAESNDPHIAYHDYSAQELKYATRSGGGPWQVGVVDASLGSGEYASLALDSVGRPHIAYITTFDLRYARHDGTGWLLETIPTGSLRAIAETVLVLDANDDPHFLWDDFFDDYGWYTRREGSGWHSEIVAAAPEFGGYDLEVDADLRPHVAFYHSDYGDLRYAVHDEPWRVQSLDSPGLVEPPSLALPVGGYDVAPAISYYKPTAGLLRALSWEEAMWQLSNVDFISAPGADPSLAVGASSRPQVSYYDADSQQLRLASWDDWQSEVVDPVAGAGRFSNLLLAGDRPDIVYWDENVRRIRLASWDPNAGEWEYSTNLVGPAAGPGSGYLSAARLSDGNIAVSYFRTSPGLEAGGGDLRLATWNGESWSDDFVAGGLDADAPYNDLAVDAVENEPAIAYYQNATQQIVYAYRQDDSWIAQTAASGVSNLTGLSLRLALDSRRQPRIAYAAADVLRLASGDDGTWVSEPIYQAAGVTLNGVSLGLGRRAHIAAGTSSGVRYAYTVASSPGPEPLILVPYDPISPFLACFEFIFGDSGLRPASFPVSAPAAGVDEHGDLDIFLQMTPMFQASAAGQGYIDLYGAHVQEMTDIGLSDFDLLSDSFGVLQNFLPGLEALVAGRGEEVIVTQEMVDDALDIWQRLAAAGSPQLAAAINGQLEQYDDLQDFAGLTFDDWALAIGVIPPGNSVYLPITHR